MVGLVCVRDACVCVCCISFISFKLLVFILEELFRVWNTK